MPKITLLMSQRKSPLKEQDSYFLINQPRAERSWSCNYLLSVHLCFGQWLESRKYRSNSDLYIDNLSRTGIMPINMNENFKIIKDFYKLPFRSTTNGSIRFLFRICLEHCTWHRSLYSMTLNCSNIQPCQLHQKYGNCFSKQFAS